MLQKVMMKNIISPYVQFRLALKYVIKKYWYRRQNVLAEEAEVSETMLSYIVKGKKNASLPTQIRLSETCGYSYENFLALGRMIHGGTKDADLPKPSKKYQSANQNGAPQLDVKQSDMFYEKNGGYKARTWQEIGGNPKMSDSVAMLIKIYDSENPQLIRLINRILRDFLEDLDSAGDLPKGG